LDGELAVEHVYSMPVVPDEGDYLVLPDGIGFKSGSTCCPAGGVAGSAVFGGGISSFPIKPREPALVPSIGVCWVAFGFVGPGERGAC
jgi:hypothetical protein